MPFTPIRRVVGRGSPQSFRKASDVPIVGPRQDCILTDSGARGAPVHHHREGVPCRTFAYYHICQKRNRSSSLMFVSYVYESSCITLFSPVLDVQCVLQSDDPTFRSSPLPPLFCARHTVSLKHPRANHSFLGHNLVLFIEVLFFWTGVSLTHNLHPVSMAHSSLPCLGQGGGNGRTRSLFVRSNGARQCM